MRRTEPEPTLASRLRRVLALLAKVQPEREDSDTLWRGPHYIPRRREWWPTTFMRYQGELYCTVQLGWSAATLVWKIGSDEVRFEGDSVSWTGYYNGPPLWQDVLEQVIRRLKRAVRNPAVYNRHVARLLPAACRTGRIRRRFSWPEGAPDPVSKADLARLEKALEHGKSAPSWSSMSLRKYLDVAALCYDAVFDDLKKLDPRQKYKRRADQRHGGLLDLPAENAAAFERWYGSRQWAGTHPWEIVFAHPHGILLSPHREGNTWRFFLSVDTLGLYVSAAHMAIAIGEAGVPFELMRATEVVAALRGEDWVEVGPFYGQLTLEELETQRKEAVRHIEWDPPQVLRLRGQDNSAPP
jgi:hypothetical protein